MAKIKLVGIEKFIKDVDRTRQEIGKASKLAMKNTALELKTLIRSEIELKRKVDTGQYKRSISTSIPILSKASVKSLVFSSLKYADVIERGRKKGNFPNLDAMVGWCYRKGIIKSGATKKYDDLKGVDKSAVFLISRAIARNGIEGAHIFENATLEFEKKMVRIFADFFNLYFFTK